MRSNPRPTLEDVARRAGVSRALVSLALKGSTRVATTTRERIAVAANELGYRANIAARNLASHRTGTIGVLLNDLHNPFFAEVFDGVAAAAEPQNMPLLLTTARNRRTGEREAIESMVEHRVDGVILVSPRLPSEQIISLATTTPTVVVGRVVRSAFVDTVTNDDAEGARLVVEHLFALGHRRIAHIDGGTGAGARARRSGFVQAAGELGVIKAEVVEGDFTEAAGSDGARRLLRQRKLPTAIFGANDLVAVGALDALIDAGRHVPDDISVVGYDNSAIAKMAHLGLTSVDQATDHLGRAAFELLCERIDGRSEQRVASVSPTLVVRRTTSAAPTP